MQKTKSLTLKRHNKYRLAIKTTRKSLPLISHASHSICLQEDNYRTEHIARLNRKADEHAHVGPRRNKKEFLLIAQMLICIIMLVCVLLRVDSMQHACVCDVFVSVREGDKERNLHDVNVSAEMLFITIITSSNIYRNLATQSSTSRPQSLAAAPHRCIFYILLSDWCI